MAYYVDRVVICDAYQEPAWRHHRLGIMVADVCGNESTVVRDLDPSPQVRRPT
jgi:hypothetical protein